MTGTLTEEEVEKLCEDIKSYFKVRTDEKWVYVTLPREGKSRASFAKEEENGLKQTLRVVSYTWTVT